MKHRGPYHHVSTLDTDPASAVSREWGEEEEERGRLGEKKNEDKTSEPKDADCFIFGENAESKLLRKFLTNWESYFNKSVKETSTEIKGKKKKQ